MYKYLIPLYLTTLFANNEMHPEDLKNRPHYALSYGVMGATYIDGNQVFVYRNHEFVNRNHEFVHRNHEFVHRSHDAIRYMTCASNHLSWS